MFRIKKILILLISLIFIPLVNADCPPSAHGAIQIVDLCVYCIDDDNVCLDNFFDDFCSDLPGDTYDDPNCGDWCTAGESCPCVGADMNAPTTGDNPGCPCEYSWIGCDTCSVIWRNCNVPRCGYGEGPNEICEATAAMPTIQFRENVRDCPQDCHPNYDFLECYAPNPSEISYNSGSSDMTIYECAAAVAAQNGNYFLIRYPNMDENPDTGLSNSDTGQCLGISSYNSDNVIICDPLNSWISTEGYFMGMQDTDYGALYEIPEEICGNSIDDDFNGLTDEEDPKCVTITGITTPTTEIFQYQDFAVTCSSTAQSNCVGAKIGDDICEFSSWTGNDALFACNSLSFGGALTVECYISNNADGSCTVDIYTATPVPSSMTEVVSVTQVCGETEICDNDIDDDCDTFADCEDPDCDGQLNGDGAKCCAFGGVATCNSGGCELLGPCSDDDERFGEIRTYTTCSEEKICTGLSFNSCTVLCGSGCCIPGATSATCSADREIFDVDIDGDDDICVSGDWKGADCGIGGCTSTNNIDYQCWEAFDCPDPGTCGVNTCTSGDYQCENQQASDPVAVCSALAGTYDCAVSITAPVEDVCTDDGETFSCNLNPSNSLCTDLDMACDPNDDYSCSHNVCYEEEVTASPCCLCYSQCAEAANDPTRDPISEDYCYPHGQWEDTENCSCTEEQDGCCYKLTDGICDPDCDAGEDPDYPCGP